MDKIKTKRRGANRKLVQLYAALLYNANLKGFVTGEIFTGVSKNICVPGLNCYSCPGAVGACPLGALQNALASSGARAPYYVLGILLLFGLTLGRTVCGWLCPMGLIQELIHKLPTAKLEKSRVTRALSWLKYIILAVFAVGIPVYYSFRHLPLPGFCKYICPAGTLEGAVALLAHPSNSGLFSVLGALFTSKFVLLVLILTACAFIYRAFCRFLCPLGAIYGLFSRLALTGVRVQADRCVGCGGCVARCKMDVRRVGDHECINCGECIDACPTKAISLKCGKLTLMENELRADDAGNEASGRPRRARAVIAWGIAIAVLAGALWYFNRPAASPVPSAPPEQTGESTGFEPGMLAPGFTVPVYGGDGGSFTPEKGRPVVINFWATWCTPCVGELPEFQKLYDAYGDKLELVAIHSSMVTDDVEAFIDREGYTLPFALDESGDVISSLGGSNILPMTVILDSEGRVVYNKVGSVSYELLEELVAPLLPAE